MATRCRERSKRASATFTEQTGQPGTWERNFSIKYSSCMSLASVTKRFLSALASSGASRSSKRRRQCALNSHGGKASASEYFMTVPLPQVSCKAAGTPGARAKAGCAQQRAYLAAFPQSQDRRSLRHQAISTSPKRAEVAALPVLLNHAAPPAPRNTRHSPGTLRPRRQRHLLHNPLAFQTGSRRHAYAFSIRCEPG